MNLLMVRILLIDDDIGYLETTKRAFERRELPWLCTTADTAARAIEFLKSASFDVVLCDMEMPDSSGETVLRHVAERLPSSVRILLSAQNQDVLIQKASGIAHQVLSKSSTAEVIAYSVQKALKIRHELNSPEIVAAVHRMKSLPTLPRAYVEITDLLRREDYHQAHLIRILSEDISLGTAVLKVANSAFYGYSRVSSLSAAVTILGTNAIKNIVFFAGLVSKFNDRNVRGFELEELWRHSVAVANNALALARHYRLEPVLVDETFTASLVHDIGKLIFLKTMRKEFQMALEIAENEAVPLHEAEAWVFGAGHEDVGAYLLQLWGLPDGVVEAVMYHHHALEAVCKSLTPLSLLCVANEIDNRKRMNSEFDIEEFELQLNTIADGDAWVGLHLAFD
jgi:putative nucleotidyltransferase with HDIG domain